VIGDWVTCGGVDESRCFLEYAVLGENDFGSHPFVVDGAGDLHRERGVAAAGYGL
jgi:hypothetical protein